MEFGIVIPCYNESNRLKKNSFINFIQNNPSYHLCFVNDGSTDNTLEVLEALREEYAPYVSVVNCAKNGGKAEAVRQGMKYLYDTCEMEYIGFLDADLSVSLEDFRELFSTIRQDSELKVVVGSRLKRLGAVISRNLKRHLIGRFMATLISILLDMPFYDTQCGAKVFHRSLIPVVFSEEFQSRWLFDVEIFMRMKQYFGVQPTMNKILEFPLRRWIHVEDSKIGAGDLYKIPVSLLMIHFHYSIRPQLVNFWLSPQLSH